MCLCGDLKKIINKNKTTVGCLLIIFVVNRVRVKEIEINHKQIKNKIKKKNKSNSKSKKPKTS